MGLWRHLRVPMALEDADDVGSEATDLTLGPDGAVWIATATALHRYPAGGDGDGERLAESPAGPFPPVLESLTVTARGVAWLGGWDGEVLRIDDGAVRVLSSSEDEPRRMVEDLAGTLWLAFRGGGVVHAPAAVLDTLLVSR